MACMAWQPADAKFYAQVVALLGQHLGSTPSHPPVVWYRRKSVRLAVLLLATTIPFVLIGLAIYALGFTWGWMYYTFIIPLVVVLGLVVFRQV